VPDAPQPAAPAPAAETAPTSAEARDILMTAIAAHAKRAPNASTLLRLSEAWAWLQDPSQAHGGRSDD
jgi:hypothetical protein